MNETKAWAGFQHGKLRLDLLFPTKKAVESELKDLYGSLKEAKAYDVEIRRVKVVPE